MDTIVEFNGMLVDVVYEYDRGEDPQIDYPGVAPSITIKDVLFLGRSILPHIELIDMMMLKETIYKQIEND